MKFFALLFTLLPAAATYAQTDVPASSSNPVAYVYVTRPTHIDGFAASSSGVLTPVPGSPFANTAVSDLAVTKKFLFGAGSEVTSYSIGSKGTLKKITSVKTFQHEPDNCTQYGISDLQVDSAGSTLYAQEDPNCQGDGASPYLSFHIESNGDMEYLGPSGGYLDDATQGYTARLHFTGAGKFGYDGECQEDNNNLSDINIYKRESNGALSYIGQSNEVPAPGISGDPYCAGLLATDGENHLAVALQQIQGTDGDNGPLYGPYYLASYTADSNGNLTTTSTAENMPEASFTGDFAVGAMSIDPTNEFLAVGGQGFAIYHFNGSKPITKYSGVLQSSVGFQEFGWDKAHHLYALGGGKLFVYTVTSSSIKEAPGSPYSIPESSSVIVLDLQ
jgi:hypothetical protein